MLRRRHIDAAPKTSRLRVALGVPAWLFRAGLWNFQDRVVWPAIDRLHGLAELLRWPFQRLGWGVERSLIWPARERIAGWGYPRRIAGSAALATVAIGAAALGVVLASQEEEPVQERLAPATQVSLAEPQPVAKAQKQDGPTLQGAAPQFGIEDGVKIASAESGAGTASDGTDAGQTDPAGSAESEDAATAAGASKQKPVPLGREAMKVARRFAEAFVFYEVGERPDRAKAIFEETATPRLADALADRPPRLPENAKVPQARVLNLVPGPRRAKTYTVSVSLLRVGATSELRLKMKRRDGAWVVTDVRG